MLIHKSPMLDQLCLITNGSLKESKSDICKTILCCSYFLSSTLAAVPIFQKLKENTFQNHVYLQFHYFSPVELFRFSQSYFETCTEENQGEKNLKYGIMNTQKLSGILIISRVGAYPGSKGMCR